jgi:hypothetical protein
MKMLNQGRFDCRAKSQFLLILCGVGVGVLSQRAVATAAPITLAFDAEVTSIFRLPISDFDIPFPVAVGDTIHGRFTFEPSPLGHLGMQETGLRFDVGKVVLDSPTYDIYTALNQASTGLPLEFFDVTEVTCSLLSIRAQCEPGSVPGAESIEWVAAISTTRNSITAIAAKYIVRGHRHLECLYCQRSDPKFYSRRGNWLSANRV